MPKSQIPSQNICFRTLISGKQKNTKPHQSSTDGDDDRQPDDDSNTDIDDQDGAGHDWFTDDDDKDEDHVPSSGSEEEDADAYMSDVNENQGGNWSSAVNKFQYHFLIKKVLGVVDAKTLTIIFYNLKILRYSNETFYTDCQRKLYVANGNDLV